MKAWFFLFCGSLFTCDVSSVRSAEAVSFLTTATGSDAESTSLVIDDAFPEPSSLDSTADIETLDVTYVSATPTETEAARPGPRARPVPRAQVAAVSTIEGTVEATRGEEDWFSTPYMVNFLDLSTLEDRQVRNLTEALEWVPGVMVQKTANGQGSPYIRGFTGYRTLTVVDGVRYNNSVYRDGPSEYFSLIDVYSINSIELLQGPGSVLYGSDAIGGTLYLQTKSSNYLYETPGQSFSHGSAYYRGQTAEQSHTGRFEFDTGVGDQWGLHLGTTVKHFGDVIAAELGKEQNTGYDEWAYDARLDVKLSDSWTFTAANQMLGQNDVWRTHSTIYGVSFAGSAIGSDLRRLKDQRRSLSFLKLRGEDLNGFVDAVTTTFSYQNFPENGERVRSDGRSQIESFDSSMWGIDFQLESDTSAGHLTYGVDYYVDHVDSARTDYNPDGSLNRRRIQGPVGDDAQFGQFGFYLQDSVDVSDRLNVTLGGRANRVSADIGRFEDPVTGMAASFSDDYSSAVGSARAIYNLDSEERYAVFGGISQSFRAPNLADLSRYGGSRSDEIESAATALQPESFLTYELGFKARADRLSGQVSAYYTGINDMITSTPTGRVVDGLREVTKQNSAEGYVQGAEASFEYDLGYGFALFGNIAWVEGEADTFPVPGGALAVREPLSRVQPVMGGGGIRFTTPSEKIRTELSVLGASGADRLNTADRGDTQRIPPGGTPGYTIVNLDTAFELNPSTTFYFGLENILDEAYRTHGSGSNEPGFGAVLGMRVNY